MNLQSSDSVNQVVCFSPTKRQLFEDAHTNNAGVSMKNVKSKGDGTIFVGDSSTVKIEKLGFKANFSLPLTSIAEVINEVPAQSKINVCGHLLLEETTSVVVKGANIPIRRGHICDGTGHIKITLWRECVDVLHDTSYIFSSVVKSIYNNCPEIQHHSKSANQYLISRDLSLTTMKLLKQPSLVRLTFVESNAFSATQMSLLVMKRRKLCNVSNVGVLLYSKTWTATNFGMLLF